jgi:chaperonin GroEL
MSKKVSFNKEALDPIIKGLDIVSDAVIGTMGPKGRNAYLMSEIPQITNDGFTVAKNIFLENKEEDAGAYIIRNLTGQQNDVVGDGTTTVACLAKNIIHECLKRPENPMEIKESLKEASDKILKLLSAKSIKVKKEDVEKVAMISAENTEISKIITEIVNKLGEKAVINVQDSRTFATEYEIVDGYEANVGFMSPHFVNDKSGKAIYNDIPVFVSQKKISNIQDISPLFNLFKENNITSCVIVCEDIDDSMLGLLVRNKAMGVFSSLVIRATGPLLKDIEGEVGATAVSSETGINFADVKIEHLGKAKKIVCDANKTLFLGDGISAKNYANILEQQAENETNMFIREKLEERINKLRGGIAILKIGAPTDLERDYLRLKAEDAVKAVQAALEEGVVEGGGMALWRIADEMNPKTIGEEILKKALKSPLQTIIRNAGKDYTEITKKLMENVGYNAKTDEFVNMLETGIVDPTKVERCALENAVSAVGTAITSFCLLTEYEKPSK